MSYITSRTTAAAALKKDIYNYRKLTKELKDDAQLLLIALNELEPVCYYTDEWDTLCFATSVRLHQKFVEALKIKGPYAESITVLIGLLKEMEDPAFYYENRTEHQIKKYTYYKQM